MKKFQFLGKVALAALALVFASCSSDDGGSGTGGNSGSYIKMKVDGSNFAAEVMDHSTVVAIRQGTGENTLVQLSGADASGNAASIILFGVTGTGTYQINPDSDSVLAYLFNSNQSYDTGECAGATGTVTVTEFDDNHIKGTFNFTGKVEESGCASKSFTDGQFRGEFMQTGM